MVLVSYFLVLTLTMVKIGNFFFRYRNWIFIIFYAALFIPSWPLFSPKKFGEDYYYWPVTIGLFITCLGQLIRGLTIGLAYTGYTITKDFYAPDYSVKKDKTQPDVRVTLDWRPDILVNFVNPKIPFSFYNNDRTKKFRVIVEGMTIDG